MSRGGPRSIGEVLLSGDISRLTAQLRERHELVTRVRAELPRTLARHVVSARLDDHGRLVLGVDSAAWAAKLRYSAPELDGRRVKVRVAVPGGGEA